MLEQPHFNNSDFRERAIRNYQGKYEIIKKAAQNIDNLKP
jgi:DeoR/GlpR family transcriptional regulator of sugar metabolism